MEVIAGMLRVAQPGQLQKVLADGLRYARDLTAADLQRCDLRNSYLGYKSGDKPYRARRRGGRAGAGAPMKPVVFVSRPSVLSPAQESVLTRWNLCVTELGFSTECLPRQRYSEKPWENLPRMLANADGVLALGFRQVTVEPCRSRPDVRPGSAWTSPWVQIEAAIAIASRTPLLVAPEPGVTEGVFDPSAWRGCAISALTAGPPAPAHIPAEWTSAVTRRFRERSR